MPLAVVDNCHIELREPAVRHVALARLAATFTATDAGLRYRQRAVHRGDRIVARRCILIECIGEGVFACTHGGLLAHERIRRPLAVHEPVAINRHFVCRKRCPVVDLRITLRGQRNRARRDPDADRADNRRVVRSRDPIPHLRVTDIAERRRHIRPDVGLVRAVLDHWRREEAVRRHSDAMRRAVIDVRVADRRNRTARPDGNRRGDHRNLARDDRDFVVRKIRPVKRRVVERVLDFSLGDRRHRRPVRGRDALARDKAKPTYHNMWAGVRRPIVDEIGFCARCQRHGTICNCHFSLVPVVCEVRRRNAIPERSRDHIRKRERLVDKRPVLHERVLERKWCGGLVDDAPECIRVNRMRLTIVYADKVVRRIRRGRIRRVGRDGIDRPARRHRCRFDDRDLARNHRDFVVRAVRPFLHDVVERVVDFALGDRRHRRPVRGRDALARDKAKPTYHNMWAGVRRPVVHEVCLRARFHRDRARCNCHGR